MLEPGWSFRLMTVLTLVTGTAFIMWLGEQITERGIGNGISLVIFGIIADSVRHRTAFGFDPDRPVFVAGSTNPSGSWCSSRASSSSSSEPAAHPDQYARRVVGNA